ncbi:MAG: AEC family transporter [Xanthobacteraceae bacterium]
MSSAAVFAALLPVFMLIVTGVLSRRYLVTDPGHWVGLERLVYYVLFPALLIDTLWHADLTRVPIAQVGGALLAAVLIMSVLCLLLRPLLTKWLSLDGPAFTSLFQGATRWQTFIGLAVSGSLYGEFGLALASVAAVAMIPVLNVINVWVLAQYAAPTAPRWRDVLLAMAKNPFIWSCVIGIALNLVHVPLPTILHIYADALGRAALALGLLLVGAGLQVKGLMRPAAATWVAAFLKLALMPAIAISLGLALGASGTPLAVIACCAAVPTAFNAYVLARLMGGDTELLAEILTVQTVLAAITMPIAIQLAS